MLMKVKITTAAAAAAVAAARRQQLSQVPCLLQVWPACTMPASWPALLASCLLQYLYFHDSNEVVIHFSVKLMMLQNLLDLYLKEMILINID